MEFLPGVDALIPYVRDVLVGLLPLVSLSEALKASFPFRERALLWYVGLIAVGLIVIDGGVPAFTALWSVHTPLTIIGYVVGVYWWLRPRPRPTPIVSATPYQESLAWGFRSGGNRRAGKAALPDWW